MSDKSGTRPDRFYLSVIETLPIPVAVIDRKYEFLFVNKGFMNVFGVLDTSLIGRNLWDCWSEEKFKNLHEAYERVFSTQEPVVVDHRSVELGHDFEIWANWCDGNLVITCIDVTIYVRRANVMQGEMKAIQSILGAVNDVNSRALSTAQTDGLTGLCTRRRVEEISNTVFRALQDQNLPVSLIMVDIDHFKNFNDTFGHAEGDHVLKLVAEAMAVCADESETVARFGGEEFLILCPSVGLREAVVRADRFLQAIRGIEGTKVPVTASFGVASASPGEHDWTQTLSRADRALYLAKSRGRDQVVPWTSVNDSADTFKSAS